MVGDWLIGWLVSLVGWFRGWLVDWLIGWLVSLVGWFRGWLVDWLIGWLVNCYWSHLKQGLFSMVYVYGISVGWAVNLGCLGHLLRG